MATHVTRVLPGMVVACAIAGALAACAATPQARLADLTALQQRADGAYARHDWHAATDAYHALARHVPADAAYWFRLGNSLARLDQPDAAVDAYREALRRDPHAAPAWHNLGSVLLQQAQAAYAQAAAAAPASAPLRADSTLLAARIAAVRAGSPDPVATLARPGPTRGAVARGNAGAPTAIHAEEDQP